MSIFEFVDRAIIIDNKEDEIITLKEELKQQDIDVTFLNPNEEDSPRPFTKNRQLLFVDLLLDENATLHKSNISRLVNLLCKLISPTFGSYGIVVWSKHTDYTNEFIGDITKAVNANIGFREIDDKEEIEINNKLLVAPLFIIELNKNIYLSRGNYEGVLNDVETKVQGSISGCFFMNWSKSVKKAVNKTIEGVYGLCNDYQKHEPQINYLLSTLAVNHTGIDSPDINITVDSYKAFDEILYANLFVQQKDEDMPILSRQELPWENKEWIKIKSKLNAKIFIDQDAITQSVIVPGNVYRLKENAANKKIIGKFKKSDKIKEESFEFEDIGIELTPPCDASNKKISSRVISGFACKIPDEHISKTKLEELKKVVTSENRYFLSSIAIEGILYAIVFDYRYLFTPNDEDLICKEKYEIWFRAKPKLFADILQKFSSHAARLGISDIH